MEIQEFSFITWILREINICESKMSQTYVLTILETLHVDFSEIVTFSSKKFTRIKVLTNLEYPKISGFH